jgi:hypothetical protein
MTTFASSYTKRRGNMRFFYVSLICVALFFSGCMDRSRVADFTLLASKNISTLENAQHMGTFECPVF